MKKGLLALSFALFLGVNQAQAGILVHDTIEPYIATGIDVANISDLKVGEGKIVHILGITSMGYAGIYDIAVQNGIKRIHHVDVRKKWFFGFGTTSVRVYGE